MDTNISSVTFGVDNLPSIGLLPVSGRLTAHTRLYILHHLRSVLLSFAYSVLFGTLIAHQFTPLPRLFYAFSHSTSRYSFSWAFPDGGAWHE